MIRRDEGTLAYCAAKIASEIEQDSNWRSSRLEVMPIDLRDELADIGKSARQIAEDRGATTALEKQSAPRRSRRPSDDRRGQGVDERSLDAIGYACLCVCRLSRPRSTA